MTLCGRLRLLLFFVTYLTSVYSAQAETLRTFDVGNDATELGLILQPNVECISPSAMSASSRSVYAILDNWNRRISVFREDAIATINLPPEREPIDVAIASKGVIVAFENGYVFGVSDDGIVRFEEDVQLDLDQPAPFLAASSNTEILLRSVDGRVLARIDTESVGDVLEPLIGQDGSSLTLANPSSGELTAAPSGTDIAMQVVSDRQIASAVLLGTTAEGHIVVEVDELQTLPEPIAASRFVKYDADQTPFAELYAPAALEDCKSPHSVAVTNDGEALFVRVVSASSIELILEEWQSLGYAQIPEPPAVPSTENISNEDFLERFENFINDGAALDIGAQPSISVADILTRAQSMETHAWTLGEANYENQGIESRCEPQAYQWRRPVELNGLLGERIIGLPYRWGGYLTRLSSFDSGLSNGRLAGDTCTCRSGENYCVVPEAIGLDCSGFVSFSWKLSGYYTTSSLSKVSDQIRWSQLRPGDIVNRAGRHVRLVVGVNGKGAGQQVQVLESAVSCGGVCRRTYTANDLQSRGYVPLRRINLIGE